MAHEMFELQADLTPEKTAIRYREERLSYAEVNRRANQLANLLQNLGAAPESRVGVYLERSIDVPIVLLGILKAGAGYIPLDHHYPTDRLEYMVQDADLFCIVHSAAVPHPGLPYSGRWIDLGGLPERQIGNPSVTVTQTNLAYLIYTSGSTGRPKGAMVCHGGMSNHLAAKIRDFALSDADMVGFNAPVSFDVSVWQMLAILLAGGTMEVIPEDKANDAEALMLEIERRGITVLETVPVMLSMMLGIAGKTNRSRKLGALRSLICNAEPLPVELVQAVAGDISGNRTDQRIWSD